MNLVIVLLLITFAAGGIAMTLGYWMSRLAAGDFDIWDLIGLRLLPEFLDFSKRTTAHTVMRVGIVAAFGSLFTLWSLPPQ